MNDSGGLGNLKGRDFTSHFCLCATGCGCALSHQLLLMVPEHFLFQQAAPELRRSRMSTWSACCNDLLSTLCLSRSILQETVLPTPSWILFKICESCAFSAALYHSPGNQFERFREVLELIRRFEFEFCRRENYFF